MSTVFITGSCSPIGYAAALQYQASGWDVCGFDCGKSAPWVGPYLPRIIDELHDRGKFTHYDLDLLHSSDLAMVRFVAEERRPDLFIHAAGQCSSELASRVPLVDFQANAQLTASLLDIFRLHFKDDATFIYPSTHKVYGERINDLALEELPTRVRPTSKTYSRGVLEGERIDQAYRGLNASSRLCADLICQEYGKHYGLNVGIFRCSEIVGCHGPEDTTLAKLVDCALTGEKFCIQGYQGKQVIDYMHVHDLIMAFESFRQRPFPGAVFNVGGGRYNAHSVIELIHLVGDLLGESIRSKYDISPCRGDFAWYISNTYKLETTYPAWEITQDVPAIIQALASRQ